MKILHVTTTDPAGAVFNWCRAINEHTEHTARLMATAVAPGFEFPQDMTIPFYDEGQEFEALLRDADVIHFHKIDERWDIVLHPRGQEKTIRLADYVAGKKVVYQMHGHPAERGNPEEHAKMYADKPADRPVLVVTPDLEEIYRPFLGERVRYMPNCVPVRDARYMPRATDELHNGVKVGKVWPVSMVVQTVTNTLLKNTNLIKRVCERLQDSGVPVFFFQVGPNPLKTQAEALGFMRQGHIVFDHVEGYYGLSSLQGLSMGKPTIAGLSDYCVRRIKETFEVDHVPWLIAREEEHLGRLIRHLDEDPAWRRDVGEVSRRFMLEAWSDRAVAARLPLLANR